MKTKIQPKNFTRYYLSRVKDSSRGGFKIHDRVLGIHIAHCDFREAAALVTKSLNFFYMTQYSAETPDREATFGTIDPQIRVGSDIKPWINKTGEAK
jgi:hypothetical protein